MWNLNLFKLDASVNTPEEALTSRSLLGLVHGGPLSAGSGLKEVLVNLHDVIWSHQNPPGGSDEELPVEPDPLWGSGLRSRPVQDQRKAPRWDFNCD
ncbi:hypothetical protein EYF80_042658 [Liparis tanakae]|uniref:Uncharacterized protein n=1 Tax=Liparis tanakae TaxID=230148 RepID=A0A4Z2G2S0_9TELE|nr:hypothetical protein EYF80_042658 [Liparis tanakae]